MMIFFRAIMSFLLLFLPQVASAQFDDFLKGMDKLALPGTKTLGDDKIISGLKEALSVGTENTVNLTGNTDGFLKNEAIKILLPEKLQSMDKALRFAGFGPQVDEFVVSMNRAAEQAAPLAKPIFKDALTNMNFDDAKKILHGGDTAATDYFKNKTQNQLATAFKPEVEKAMNQVGVTAQYKELVGQYTTLPFVKVPAFDLDNYVVGKSLDGLFYTLAEEEKKIRTNPAAQVTDLLKEVFGK
ncbi:MAG: DUF4197 domain-containing protein [Nitrospirota bacterium]|nr:DUF4197 domain-containing protein [Nitrospirota bacterium]MDH4359915.1 DUF4197 domain-containing protein [Nitrospirota bacterium]MDH5295954.1 DUF4197 domain-containing protein [Nitrospirota bacterium]MDH5576264.1 DUF4197 domain-containing protein [Nitrospirota bacterium]